MAASNLVSVVATYRLTVVTGSCTGIAAGGAIFAARWSDANYSARIRSLEVSHLVTTGYTAAQEVGYDVIIGRSWTVSPSGGTAATLTGNMELTGFGATKFAAGDIRVATTGALTNGTVTLDPQPICRDGLWALAATAGGSIQRVYPFSQQNMNAGHPISRIGLQANDGILVRNAVAQGAAGVGRWVITMEWDEVI